ncbi:uncharacterized protein L969DRAFT_96033 [Mixia osmundae IAM 14324]|uniref:Uncharacterized protein n=1 Tax=Mixia osmundae (strain CBS 9802 / IAM 14324 / JCM 22182 / KY 12970) TaxID=764103 RepID=G7DS83_MIXOS|nr:uncharacterized protein L969DRAFT_96033 [Mixia osmundae IAM 14324]KEI37503.1 hypothetical protein L969DRAFT_96033 [Mixia osmundae IAM 14324]GAA93443.1 hypothetical protein E5Q_00084 [Mixia osmundae IAM 14324]
MLYSFNVIRHWSIVRSNLSDCLRTHHASRPTGPWLSQEDSDGKDSLAHELTAQPPFDEPEAPHRLVTDRTCTHACSAPSGWHRQHYAGYCARYSYRRSRRSQGQPHANDGKRVDPA